MHQMTYREQLRLRDRIGGCKSGASVGPDERGDDAKRKTVARLVLREHRRIEGDAHSMILVENAECIDGIRRG